MARHVLLADDSTTIHRIVRDILEPENIQVTCVENGEEALRSILESTPDLVLADLTMPRMGGLDMCDLMRREAEFEDIPVIFLVSPFDEFDQAAAARVGGTGHLVKPFDSYRLTSLINEYLTPEIAEVAALEDVDEAEDSPVEAASAESWDDVDDEDASELPEPLGLTGRFKAVGIEAEEEEDEELEELPDDSLSIAPESLEPGPEHRAEVLSDGDDSLSPKTVELSMADAELIDDVEEGEGRLEYLEPAPADDSFAAVGGGPAAERALREVIREEVRRILPAIVEAVVRERVLELELELDAMNRAKSAGRAKGREQG